MQSGGTSERRTRSRPARRATDKLNLQLPSIRRKTLYHSRYDNSPVPTPRHYHAYGRARTGWREVGVVNGHCPCPIDSFCAGTIPVVAVVVSLRRRDRRTGPEWCCRPRPSRVLPLRLCRQTIGLARFFAQPRHETLRIPPAHIDHRLRSPPPTLVAGPVPVTCGRYRARIPLRERHLIATERKRLRHRHFPLRAFIGLPICLSRGRAHRERAGGDDDHLGAVGAVPEHRAGLAISKVPA